MPLFVYQHAPKRIIHCPEGLTNYVLCLGTTPSKLSVKTIPKASNKEEAALWLVV